MRASIAANSVAYLPRNLALIKLIMIMAAAGVGDRPSALVVIDPMVENSPEAHGGSGPSRNNQSFSQPWRGRANSHPESQKSESLIVFQDQGDIRQRL
jgi:hypothetical protein